MEAKGRQVRSKTAERQTVFRFLEWKLVIRGRRCCGRVSIPRAKRTQARPKKSKTRIGLKNLRSGITKLWSSRIFVVDSEGFVTGVMMLTTVGLTNRLQVKQSIGFANHQNNTYRKCYRDIRVSAYSSAQYTYVKHV